MNYRCGGGIIQMSTICAVFFGGRRSADLLQLLNVEAKNENTCVVLVFCSLTFEWMRRNCKMIYACVVTKATVASTFIPFFSGIFLPVFRGTRYIDGGFTDNCPSIDEHTITVNPFCGESDICPIDDTSHLIHVSCCYG